MIPDIKEINFPQYATLSEATIVHNDMGDKSISAQIEIDGDIMPDFSYEWEVEFKAERYIHPIRIPQALKDNTSICSKIDLVFQHKTIYELKRYFFIELASTQSGTPIADKYIASLGLSLEDFVIAFQNVLNFYFKGEITIDLCQGEYSQERKFISISYSHIWDVLQEMYNVYGVRWEIKGSVIKVGYPYEEVSHIFGYGYERGLISIERQVQNSEIRNSLLGRGGSKNLPRYYFKNAPEGSIYASDPDAIPELANIGFTELRGKTFRDYVKGWKAAHYGGAIMDEPTEAFTKGYTDVDFDPIEYVKDDISIAKYGLLPGGLENNEEIYPSIQNYIDSEIGLVNEVVEVEQVLSDDVDTGENGENTISNVEFVDNSDDEWSVGIFNYAGVLINTKEYKTVTVTFKFRVEEGFKGTLIYEWPKLKVYKTAMLAQSSNLLDENLVSHTDFRMVVLTPNGWQLDFNEINITAGEYTGVIYTTVKLNEPYIDDLGVLSVGAFASLEEPSVNILQSRISDNATTYWKPTFDIWIKNIWGTTRNPEETEKQYSERVWLPILGSEGEEATITFSSGWLSQSSDWDFKIVKGGFAYDTSKSITIVDKDGIEKVVKSEWRLTLQKTDAELEATGLYIPNKNTNGNAQAGDTFFFTGIEMPQKYVEWGESRVDEWKYGTLDEVADIQPTWVAKLDKPRINTLQENETELLINSLKEGAQIKIADPRFIEDNITLHISSIVYTYGDEIVPDVEVTLSDKIIVQQSPVEQIQSDISYLSQQIVSETRLQQMIRKICDAIYLRKDGFPDTSKSETTFNSIVKSGDFRQGGLGGSGWGIYRDGSGNAVAEIDRLFVRQDFNINTLVVNQSTYIGGRQITSAAFIECTHVQYDENDEVYKCYFDTKRGSIKNLFQVNDIAYSERYSFDTPLPDEIEFETPIDIENYGEITIAVDGVGYRIYDIAVRATISAGDTIHFNLATQSIVHETQGDLQCMVEITDANNADYDYTSPKQPYSTIKFYKRTVEDVGDDYISLSTTEVNGEGIPLAGDVIIHFGNSADKNRQYVIIRDVIGGGYERMLSGLNSVDAVGNEYYFAGRQDGQTPRWFIGDKNNEYAEWKDGRFTIVGKLGVRNAQGKDEYSEIERCLITGELVAGDMGAEHLRLNDEGLQFIDYDYAQEDENGNTIQGTEVFGGFYYKQDDYGQPYLSLTLGRFQPEGEREPRKIELTYQEISLQNEENRLFCTLTAEALTFVDTPAECQTTKLTAKGLTTDFIEYQGYEVKIATAGAYKGCLYVDIQE